VKSTSVAVDSPSRPGELPARRSPAVVSVRGAGRRGQPEAAAGAGLAFPSAARGKFEDSAAFG
jgi:hypothetical protein